VQGNFPKYADVIPRECTRKATINSAVFEHRIRQAALLTNEESKGVRLSFSKDSLTLTSRAPESGEAEVTCPITFEGDPMDIAFNPAFLVDALKVAGAENISFEMNASNKPAVIKAGTDFLYVIMPVDLS
jgi:DNA polymerase-3 subunit beta